MAERATEKLKFEEGFVFLFVNFFVVKEKERKKMEKDKKIKERRQKMTWIPKDLVYVNSTNQKLLPSKIKKQNEN
jgi:hypothetical protein